MATSWSQSRLNKANYYPVDQWCNISLNSFLLTFLSTSGGNHSNKQPNNLRDQDLDTYHSLTFRLPTWSVPTAVFDTDFWAWQGRKLACKYFWLATVFRIYLQHLLTILGRWEKLNLKLFLHNISSLHPLFINERWDAHKSIVWVGAVINSFSTFFVYKNIVVLLAKTKMHCWNIAMISAQCFWTGGDLLYLLSGGIWPREAEIKQHVIQGCCRTRHLSSACDLV